MPIRLSDDVRKRIEELAARNEHLASLSMRCCVKRSDSRKKHTHRSSAAWQTSQRVG